jgi:hypothetical protein
MKVYNLFIFGAILVFLSSCQQKVDKKKLEQELLELHQETIQAHLNKDVDFFIRDISDDYMQVHDGEFLYPTKKDIQKMFTHYLNSTDFSVYRDVSEPIVKVADDGSLGWTIVQVRVKGKQQTETDSIYKLDYTFAWITLYERENTKWIRLGEVDNFKIGE